jgi:hypothetical protein
VEATCNHPVLPLIRIPVSSQCRTSDSFNFVLTPLELVYAVKNSFFIFGVLFLINLFAARVFGPQDLAAYMGAVLIGTVGAPVLLPIIPGCALSWKGWLLGLLWAVFIIKIFGWFSSSLLLAIGYLLLLPAISAYLTLNFTGSTTYTSFSVTT